MLKLFVFYWPSSVVFFIICFSSSSINVKKKFWGVPQLLHMCVIFVVYLAYVPTLLFWTGVSCPPCPSGNLLFWEDPDLNIKYLWIFQVNHTFYKLDVKILAANNKIRCLSSSYAPSSSSVVDPCQQKYSLFWH